MSIVAENNFPFMNTNRVEKNSSFFQGPKSMFSVYISAIAFFSAIFSVILLYIANQIGLDCVYLNFVDTSKIVYDCG